MIDRLYLAWCVFRRWFKCNVRRRHYYKFAEKRADGSRLLRCTRCRREMTTNARLRKMVDEFPLGKP